MFIYLSLFVSVYSISCLSIVGLVEYGHAVFIGLGDSNKLNTVRGYCSRVGFGDLKDTVRILDSNT